MKDLDDHSWFTLGSSSRSANSDKAPAALSPPRYGWSIVMSIWSNRFIIAAIIHGAVITGLTLTFARRQMVTSGTNIIELLLLSFEGPSGSSSGTFFTLYWW
jgi:hypothetical protein